MNRKTDIGPKEITEALKEPNDFGYGGNNEEMFNTWSLGPVIRTRDSSLLQESNASAIVKALKSVPEIAEDWRIVGANHWACGWVEHLSFRAVEADGVTPTRAFVEIMELQDALDSYPILDESDLSEREYEATCENIAQVGRNMVKDNAPEGWEAKVFSWFCDNDQSAVEATDGGGGYPKKEQMRAALTALDLLDPEST